MCPAQHPCPWSLTPCLRLQGGPLGGGPGHLLHMPYSLYGLVLQRIRITQETRSNVAGGGRGRLTRNPQLRGGGGELLCPRLMG